MTHMARELDPVAKKVAYLTRDLEVVGLRSGCSKLCFRLSPLIHVRKVVSGFGKKKYTCQCLGEKYRTCHELTVEIEFYYTSLEK